MTAVNAALEAAEAYTAELVLEQEAREPEKLVSRTELVAVQGIALRALLFHGFEAIVAALQEGHDG